jgi:hypothetical protein
LPTAAAVIGMIGVLAVAAPALSANRSKASSVASLTANTLAAARAATAAFCASKPRQTSWRSPGLAANYSSIRPWRYPGGWPPAVSASSTRKRRRRLTSSPPSAAAPLDEELAITLLDFDHTLPASWSSALIQVYPNACQGRRRRRPRSPCPTRAPARHRLRTRCASAARTLSRSRAGRAQAVGGRAPPNTGLVGPVKLLEEIRADDDRARGQQGWAARRH